ncbi:lysozyme inhibitor LprI family protein [Acinetobacter beijerinckii]|uniref:lysozyme inhibitor LprI family protein n=1 Tax=Acinetobacter beijerinckii TaxID=262668 RepID=UPI0005EEDA0F|nr:lysozyme inhibitor LprI family protein [Acinetobacter beijerinckii]
MERLILCFLFIFFSINVHADMVGCKGLSKQSDLNNCANNFLAKTNEKLNKVYSNYLSDLTPDEQSKLKESQKIWGQFKDKDCAFESSPVKKGSMYPYVLSSCLVNRNEIRIVELENMMSCKNGTEPSCI